MKATVFGGSGFLGSYVADELTERGFEVSIFDLKKSPFIKPQQKFILGNIENPEDISNAVAGADYIFNFAGLSDLNESIQDPMAAIRLNILSNAQILEACRKEKIKRFVYASTVYVFSSHGSFYGISKRSSEKIIEEYSNEFGIPFTIIRYGSVYGKRANEKNRIYRLIKDALENDKITFLGDGEEEREYIHVQDAAKLSVDVLDDKYKNKHIILTGVERFKYSQLLNMIREIMNNKIEIQYLDQDYKGHYHLTPYSFNPPAGVKLMSNPYIDFGQGLLETISDIYEQLNKEKK